MAMLPSASTVPYIERRIFVGGLPSGVTEEVCKQCFEKFGRIVEVVLIYRKEDRKPRGFGFITFDSDEAVQRVIALRFIPLNEKMVEVKRAEPYIGHKKKTNTSEASGLQLAPSSSYNLFYCSNYFLPSSYDPAYYSNYFPYYSSFYNPFPPFYALPYSSLPVQYNYYPYVPEVGGPSVTLYGDDYGSPSSIVPYNLSPPMNADPIPISDVETTSRIGCGGSNQFAVSNYSNGIVFDENSNTFTETVQDKFVDSMKDSHIGSSATANTKQNEDDLADSSKITAKSEENKADDRISLNCNGSNPCAHCNGNSTS